MIVSISGKTNIVVKKPEDFDVPVSFIPVHKGRSILAYDRFIGGKKSTDSNCYFELDKFDSASKGYINITNSFIGSGPQVPFNSIEEMMTFDFSKTLVSGFGKTLTFNLLDLVPQIPAGTYLLTVFVRVANNYGYNTEGKIVVNSILYFESTPIKYVVLNDLITPNQLR